MGEELRFHELLIASLNHLGIMEGIVLLPINSREPLPANIRVNTLNLKQGTNIKRDIIDIRRDIEGVAK